jgi:preprotein translocase subunit YajC
VHNYSSILLIVVMLAVFYALLILPQRRQQKQRQAMMAQLGPGAKILTAGGIYGEVVHVENDILLVRVARDVELEVDNRAVIRVISPAPKADAES